MLKRFIWFRAVQNIDRKGMLCIGCLELRLGRLLGSKDFIKCDLNEEKKQVGSKRLIDRLTNF